MARQPMSVLDLLTAGGEEAPRDKILLEARIMRLKEEFARYGKNKFKPGDIVTALPTSIIRWAGLPMIVLEVRDPVTPIFISSEGDGSSSYGGKPAVRCAHISDCGHTVRHWYEAEDLELYSYMPNTKETGHG